MKVRASKGMKTSQAIKLKGSVMYLKVCLRISDLKTFQNIQRHLIEGCKGYTKCSVKEF